MGDMGWKPSVKWRVEGSIPAREWLSHGQKMGKRMFKEVREASETEESCPKEHGIGPG